MKRGLILTGKGLLFMAVTVIISVYAATSAYCSGLEPNLWIETFDDPALDGFLAPSINLFTDIQQTSEGGYIVAGITDTPEYREGVWLLKIERNGDIAWQEAWDGGFNPKIQQTADGGCMLFGGLFANYYPRPECVIMKIDRNGQIVWSKNYQHLGVMHVMIDRIEPTNDGGYVVAGELKYDTSSYGLWVMKLDHQGDITWQKIYLNDSYLYYSPVILRSDGQGFFLAATHNFFGRSSFRSQILMMNLDKDGDITEQKILKSRELSVESLHEITEPGYIMTGKIYDNDVVSILKFDSNGSIVWQKGYVHPMKRFRIRGGIPTSDRGCVAFGYLFDNKISNLDVMMLKLDKDGVLQWQKSYGVLLRGERVAACRQTNDDGLIVAGDSDFRFFGPDDVGITDRYGWVMRLDKDGLVPGCPFVYPAMIKEMSSNVSIEIHISDMMASPGSFVCTENNAVDITETAIQPRRVCAGGFE